MILLPATSERARRDATREATLATTSTEGAGGAPAKVGN